MKKILNAENLLREILSSESYDKQHILGLWYLSDEMAPSVLTNSIWNKTIDNTFKNIANFKEAVKTNEIDKIVSSAKLFKDYAIKLFSAEPNVMEATLGFIENKIYSFCKKAKISSVLLENSYEFLDYSYLVLTGDKKLAESKIKSYDLQEYKKLKKSGIGFNVATYIAPPQEWVQKLLEKNSKEIKALNIPCYGVFPAPATKISDSNIKIIHKNSKEERDLKYQKFIPCDNYEFTKSDLSIMKNHFPVRYIDFMEIRMIIPMIYMISSSIEKRGDNSKFHQEELDWIRKKYRSNLDLKIQYKENKSNKNLEKLKESFYRFLVQTGEFMDVKKIISLDIDIARCSLEYKLDSKNKKEEQFAVKVNQSNSSTRSPGV